MTSEKMSHKAAPTMTIMRNSLCQAVSPRLRILSCLQG
jgi:hypothetical protein